VDQLIRCFFFAVVVFALPILLIPKNSLVRSEGVHIFRIPRHMKECYGFLRGAWCSLQHYGALITPSNLQKFRISERRYQEHQDSVGIHTTSETVCDMKFRTLRYFLVMTFISHPMISSRTYQNVEL